MGADAVDETGTPQFSHGSLDVAGTARRSIAFIVDTLVVSLLLLAVAAALTVVFGPAIRFTGSPGQPLSASFHDRLLLVGAVSSIMLSAAYFAVSWSRFRATPGQYMLGLRISSRSSGGRLGVAHAMIRWAALGAPLWILSSLVAGLGGFVATLASVAWMTALLVASIRDESGQGPHDRWSGSVVTRNQRPAPRIDQDRIAK